MTHSPHKIALTYVATLAVSLFVAVAIASQFPVVAQEEAPEPPPMENRYVIETGAVGSGIDGLWVLDRQEEKIYLYTLKKDRIQLKSTRDLP